MALVLADRVKESTTTTGTNDFVLGGAYSGFQTFASSVGVNNTTYYAIAFESDWEVGLGTLSNDGLTLARTTVLQSSNSDAKVSFSVGQKEVFVTYAADKAVFEDASGNVSLPANLTVAGGSTTDSVQLDLSAGVTPAVGQIAWDSSQGTASLGLLGGNIISRLGQSLIAYVTNAESVTITKGQAVYLFSAQGDRATVKLANNTSDATSAKTFGIVGENITANGTGFVICQGVAYGLNLSAFTAGDTLYLGSTAGSVTATKPYAPNHLVYIGIVEKANAGAGQLYVRVQNGYELDEIHDVSIVSPTTGQTLVYNATTDLWENSNAPVINETTINNTTIGATTPSTGVFTTLTATGQTSLGGVAGSESLRAVTRSGANMYVQVQGGVQGTYRPNIGSIPPSTGAGFSIFNGGSGPINFGTTFSSDTITEQMRVAHTNSAVNYVQVTGAATGARPTISAQGSDAAVDLNFAAKGIGGIYFQQFSVFGSGKFNNWTTDGAVTGLSPFLRAGGGDTNVSATFGTKGTGAINLAAGSRGVNISNGGTVTAITRTAGGGSYTSTPTVVISAPTTAGGVQATATVTVSTTGTPTIVSGGTGYTVGDVLSIVGGTPVSVAATMTVTSVSGGVVTAASYTNFAQYTTPPTGTISVTGGTGSGATFNISFAVTTAFTITNAGSGYVEQPTVTFSGGGGSGAAAYATVGSGTTIRGLGGSGSSAQSISFATPSGESFRVATSTTSGTSANYLQAASGATGNGVWFSSQGSDSNVWMTLATKGTGNFQFLTNLGQEQLRVAHTASAVNYVQVTGSATGAGASALAGLLLTGSDSQPSFAIGTKATTGYIAFYGSNSTANQAFRVLTASAVSTGNLIAVQGSAAGSSPSIQAISGPSGSDANIDLTLTPKGTGNVRFGTYTGTALSIAGYIEIKDSGGTVRKLAVVA